MNFPPFKKYYAQLLLKRFNPNLAEDEYFYRPS